MPLARRPVRALRALALAFCLAASPAAAAPERITTAVLTADLSFLNHAPAGSRGRVRAEGDALVYPDGTPARFWGVNLQAYALFLTPPAQVRAHARRLARLGVNLARIHHHDSHWVWPNVFGEDAGTSGTRRLDRAALDRIDFWVKALRDEGIYIWLDLHVGRRLTAADGIDDAAEIIGGAAEGDLRGFSYVNDSIGARMKEFATAYLDRTNRYTGLAYTEDPAILAVLVTNENDLTHHFGNSLLPDKNVPAHSARYMALAQAFARTHGLDPERTWRSWEHGPSKLFLADLERRFYDDQIAHVRGLGYDGLVAASNFWGGMTASGLPALTRGDVIDAHAYGQPGETGLFPEGAVDLASHLAGAQLAGRPFTVSEWNLFGFPAPDRGLVPLRVGAMAALQGWDAMMLYGYAQAPLGDDLRPDNWHAANDPGLLATMPAAALLHRLGQVPPAGPGFVISPAPEEIYDAPLTAGTSAAIRTLAERARISLALPETPALPWLAPASLPPGAIPVRDMQARPAVAGAGLARHPERGLFTVDTPVAQVAAGRLSGEAVRLGTLEASLEAPLAAVAVQSLSAAPLGEAAGVLVTIAGPAMPAAPDALPFFAEPLSGRISFAAPANLVPLGPLPRGVSHRVAGTRHTITLDNAPGIVLLTLGAGP